MVILKSYTFTIGNYLGDELVELCRSSCWNLANGETGFRDASEDAVHEWNCNKNKFPSAVYTIPKNQPLVSVLMSDAVDVFLMISSADLLFESVVDTGNGRTNGRVIAYNCKSNLIKNTHKQIN